MNPTFSTIEEEIAHWRSEYMSLYIRRQDLQTPSLFFQIFSNPEQRSDEVKKITKQLRAIKDLLVLLNYEKLYFQKDTMQKLRTLPISSN
jgi:hypothetical protein